jgi:hypothetical protein
MVQGKSKESMQRPAMTVPELQRLRDDVMRRANAMIETAEREARRFIPEEAIALDALLEEAAALLQQIRERSRDHSPGDWHQQDTTKTGASTLDDD